MPGSEQFLAALELVEQAEGLAERLLLVPSAAAGIAPDHVFIQVVAMGETLQILQTLLLGGPSVAEMGAVGIYHVEMISAAGIHGVEEVGGIEVAVENAAAVHEHDVVRHGVGKSVVEVLLLDQLLEHLPALALLVYEIAYRKPSSLILLHVCHGAWGVYAALAELVCKEECPLRLGAPEVGVYDALYPVHSLVALGDEGQSVVLQALHAVALVLQHLSLVRVHQLRYAVYEIRVFPILFCNNSLHAFF